MTNRVITNPAVQWKAVKVAEFDSTSVNESGVVTLFQLPQAAVVTGGHFVPDGDYDATTATMALGDASDAARYLAATDVKVNAETLLLTDGNIVGPGNTDIIATFAIAGVPTVGGGRATIEYYEIGRGHTNHGQTVETP